MVINNIPIYSIGHGARKIEAMIALLKDYGIAYVIDVRSHPVSRFNPQYNRNSFSSELKKQGIHYVFMGDLLGGRPRDLTCYDDDGRVNYEKVKEKDFFLAGIGRLKNAYDQNLVVACLCSEISPCDCHRSKLIGVMLEQLDIEMVHIDKNGEVESQKSTMDAVLNRNIDLFSDNSSCFLKSIKSYK